MDGIKRAKKGFTLIELLVALVIFGILFVGLLNGVFFGMQANLLNSQRVRARQILTTFMDELKNLPPEHPYLIDNNPSNTLDDLTNPDNEIFVDTFGLRWRIVWNIKTDSLDSDLLHIRVYVLWRDNRFFVNSQTIYYKGG